MVYGRTYGLCSFSIKVEKPVISVKSEFQRIDVLDTYEFGRMLVVDGWLMLTERTSLSTMR